MTINDHIEIINENTFDLINQMGGGSNPETKPVLANADIIEGDEEEEDEEDEEIIDPLESKGKTTPQAVIEDDSKAPLAILQEQWIADGRLPKDFVITDDEEKLDQAVYDHKVKLLLEDKIAEHITKNGLTEIEIAQLRGQKLGIDTTQYNKANAYTELSKIQFDSEKDDYQANLKQFLTLYYNDLGLPKKKVESSIEEDLDSEDIQDTIKEAQTHFAKQASSVTKQIKAAEDAAAKSKEDTAKANIEKERGLLKTKVVADRQFTDEEVKFLEKALFEKTETYTRKDGLAVKATAYEKKVWEVTNNHDKAFLSKLLFILEDFKGDSPQEKAGKSILKQLKNATQQISKHSSADVQII
jgi:hypothetical protein